MFINYNLKHTSAKLFKCSDVSNKANKCSDVSNKANKCSDVSNKANKCSDVSNKANTILLLIAFCEGYFLNFAVTGRISYVVHAC